MFKELILNNVFVLSLVRIQDQELSTPNLSTHFLAQPRFLNKADVQVHP